MAELPQVHPRTIAMNEAKRELDAAWLQIRRKHELSAAEEISILAGAISTITHYAIRTERDQVEEQVEAIAEEMRENLKQPFSGEPMKMKPETKCVGMMSEREQETCKDLGIEPFKCCDRAGEYNGYGSGPTKFTCPKHCCCHD